jgi:ABC-type transport system involved in multi-copper enzyme maturation permease subunit
MNNLYVIIVLAIVAGIVFAIIRWNKSRGKVEIILEKSEPYSKGEIVKGKIVVSYLISGRVIGFFFIYGSLRTVCGTPPCTRVVVYTGHSYPAL